jgi:hypothetical protein
MFAAKTIVRSRVILYMSSTIQSEGDMVSCSIGRLAIGKIIRSEFKIKLKNMNKNTMVIVSRVFIFYDFSTYLPLRRIHFLHRSSQRLKAAANSSTPILLVTPSQVFLSVSGVNRMPASSSFTLRKRKKSAGARSGEYGGCSKTWTLLAAIQVCTTAAV